MKTLTAFTNRLGNRASNQDRCLVLRKRDRLLLAVADGMGGHARGDLAAQTAIDSLADSFLRRRDAIDDPPAFLRTALENAHLDVVDAARRIGPRLEPRTTCVVCLVAGNRAWWAHVGDSRLYLLREGRLVARTRDHTPVEELLQRGAIGEHELRHHPLRNSVSRCLGGRLRLPEISFDQAVLQAGDTLLLCSDGLWSALPEERLTGFPASGDLEQALERLAGEAEAASYPHSDNISLVGLRWLEAGESAPGPSPAPATAPENPGADNATDDPLKQAIDEIHRAILEYAGEMKK
ncbi:MAG TPA: serine/threonine-protein phosphatase [Gammaproteobacteria bacterium]|nr:serine/threonine-protein phosphatase [Gammaproteobacteria bacterium]